MRIFVVRHAEYSGEHLTKYGKKQAEKIGQKIAEKISEEKKEKEIIKVLIFTSPAIRAKETAELIAQQIQAAKIKVIPELYSDADTRLLDIEKGIKKVDEIAQSINPEIIIIVTHYEITKLIFGYPLEKGEQREIKN